MMRLCAGDEYINTAHRHIPAFLACDVTRATPLPRPLVRRAPVHPLAGSFPWSRAILLMKMKIRFIWAAIHSAVRVSTGEANAIAALL
jgi:hypothetical protein